MKYFLFLILLTNVLFTSCSEDEDPIPAYIQDLGEIQTDAQGIARTLTLDKGKVLTISNPTGGLQADTLIRVRALYQESETSIWLSDFVPVLTPHLAHFKPEVVKTDPVSVTACWRVRHYVNLRLAILGTATGTHIFGFHETRLIKHKDGTQTLQTILLHDRNNDPQHYTREAFLSLPLRPLESRLQSGRDTLQLSIMTEKGWEVNKLVF